MVSKQTRPTKGFKSVGLWSIEFESVGLLDWAWSSRPNRLSVRNSLKREIKEWIRSSLS